MAPAHNLSPSDHSFRSVNFRVAAAASWAICAWSLRSSFSFQWADCVPSLISRYGLSVRAAWEYIAPAFECQRRYVYMHFLYMY
jgi:hypothetical protein